jgi:hypothetical protein
VVNGYYTIVYYYVMMNAELYNYWVCPFFPYYCIGIHFGRTMIKYSKTPSGLQYIILNVNRCGRSVTLFVYALRAVNVQSLLNTTSKRELILRFNIIQYRDPESSHKRDTNEFSFGLLRIESNIEL